MKLIQHPSNCEQCHRPGSVTLVTLAPINNNPATRWLCRKCAGPARQAMREYIQDAAKGRYDQLQAKGAVKAAKGSAPHPAVVGHRARIFAREQGCCAYCRDLLDETEATLDHVLPKSRGGGGGVSNLVLSCFDCNNLKGDRTPDEAGLRRLNWPEGLTWKPAPFWQAAQVMERNPSRLKALRAGAGC